jgi:hypothetical protein
MRWLEIAHIGNGRVGKIWRRRRETPTHHCELALAIRRNADHGGHCVREYSGEAWQIARQITIDAEQAAHCLLAAGDTVEVAHFGK